MITWIWNKNLGEEPGIYVYFRAVLILGTSILVAAGVNEIRKCIISFWSRRNKVDVIEG